MAMGNQGGRFVELGDVSVSTTLGFLSLSLCHSHIGGGVLGIG
jgi:hypothetical protein